MIDAKKSFKNKNYSDTLFPKIDIPDFEALSKKKSWNPKKYQPMVYNADVIKKSKTLKPGTIAYDDFWDEMDYYCIKGYQPEGMPRITGRHFYYLNFTKIERLKHKKSKRKTHEPPLYRDLDHMLFLELEAAQEYGYGLIIGKPRRVGLSEFGAITCNYDLTFFKGSKVGAGAGKEDKVVEFFEKVKSSLRNTHEAYRNGILKQNKNELQLGYEDVVNKIKTDQGLESIMRVKTMFSDSGAFEGGSYNVVIFEEAGLFDNLTMSFTATQPCFMDGNVQFGIPLVYGTGGDIEKGSGGYKYMWDNHFAYNLKKIFIPAYLYYPGDGMPDEKTGEVVTFFDPKTGVTNRKAARDFILAERKMKERLDKDSYIKHIQSYPILESDIFIRTKGGILDILKLEFQKKRIDQGDNFEPVEKGRLVWVDTPETIRLLERCKNLKEKTKVRVSNKSKVSFVPDEENYFMIKNGNPINDLVSSNIGYKPDIGACDSYDEAVNTTKSSSNYSSGCIMAYRCFSGPSREFNYPVGLIVERGDASFDDDVFYEHSVMFAIYWDIEVLIEHTKFHIERYFKDVGAEKYLKRKPRISVTEGHANEYGIKMPYEVKSLGEKLLKTEVRDNIHNYFIEEVVIDMTKYGLENTDITMALMICLLYKLDMFEDITENIENGDSYFEEEGYNMAGRWYVDVNGELQYEIDDYFSDGKISTFIPERDLTKSEYQEYEFKKEKRNSEIQKDEVEFMKRKNEIIKESFFTNGSIFDM